LAWGDEIKIAFPCKAGKEGVAMGGDRVKNILFRVLNSQRRLL
jgi:hypothetical protein